MHALFFHMSPWSYAVSLFEVGGGGGGGIVGPCPSCITILTCTYNLVKKSTRSWHALHNVTCSWQGCGQVVTRLWTGCHNLLGCQQPCHKLVTSLLQACHFYMGSVQYCVSFMNTRDLALNGMWIMKRLLLTGSNIRMVGHSGLSMNITLSCHCRALIVRLMWNCLFLDSEAWLLCIVSSGHTLIHR